MKIDLNAKIAIGIIAGIAIIVLVLGFSSSEDRVIKDIDLDGIDIISDDEGRQFSLELADTVTAVGP